MILKSKAAIAAIATLMTHANLLGPTQHTVSVPLTITEQTGDWSIGFFGDIGPPYLPNHLRIQKEGTDQPGHVLMAIPPGSIPLGTTITRVQIHGVGMDDGRTSWTLIKLHDSEEISSLHRGAAYQTFTGRLGTRDELELATDPTALMVDEDPAEALYLLVYSASTNVPFFDRLLISYE